MSKEQKERWRAKIECVSACFEAMRHQAAADKSVFCRSYIATIEECLERWSDRLDIEQISPGGDIKTCIAVRPGLPGGSISRLDVPIGINKKA